MSRASLVRDAKAAKVNISGINSRVLSVDQLRVKLLEHIYGPNLGKITGKADYIDTGITHSLAGMRGELGQHLQMSQWNIRKGNNERGEALKLAATKKPDWDAIDALLKSAKGYLSMAAVSQNLHSIEVGIQDNKESEYKEST